MSNQPRGTGEYQSVIFVEDKKHMLIEAADALDKIEERDCSEETWETIQAVIFDIRFYVEDLRRQAE